MLSRPFKSAVEEIMEFIYEGHLVKGILTLLYTCTKIVVTYEIAALSSASSDTETPFCSNNQIVSDSSNIISTTLLRSSSVSSSTSSLRTVWTSIKGKTKSNLYEQKKLLILYSESIYYIFYFISTRYQDVM